MASSQPRPGSRPPAPRTASRPLLGHLRICRRISSAGSPFATERDRHAPARCGYSSQGSNASRSAAGQTTSVSGGRGWAQPTTAATRAATIGFSNFSRGSAAGMKVAKSTRRADSTASRDYSAEPYVEHRLHGRPHTDPLRGKQNRRRLAYGGRPCIFGECRSFRRPLRE